MEVGAPAGGIELRNGANALTPRHGDLEAGIWAGDPSLQRPSHSILSEPRVAVADTTLVFYTRR
jgi:hypothetical protein